MPYIEVEDRKAILAGDKVLTSGELNFAISDLLNTYIKDNGLNYSAMNDVMGALEGAKFEFYTRVVVPYEDKKIDENGDVYDPEILSSGTDDEVQVL